MPEVRLGPARGIGERNEDLSGPVFQVPNDLFDRRVPPVVTVFFLETVEDPLGRMALFPRSFLVRDQDLPIRGMKRPILRFGRGLLRR